MRIDEIIKINKKRWEIEVCFRIMKTEFKTRPIYLQKEEYIKAHFITCYIAIEKGGKDYMENIDNACSYIELEFVKYGLKERGYTDAKANYFNSYLAGQRVFRVIA